MKHVFYGEKEDGGLCPNYFTPKILDEEAKDIHIPDSPTKNILMVTWEKITVTNSAAKKDKTHWMLKIEEIEFAKSMTFNNLPSFIRHPVNRKQLLAPTDFSQIEDIMNHHRWILEDDNTVLILTKKIEESERELAKLTENL